MHFSLIDSMYRVSKENANWPLNMNILGCIHTTDMCNMAMERKIYKLLEDIFKNCEIFSYEAYFEFFW